MQSKHAFLTVATFLCEINAATLTVNMAGDTNINGGGLMGGNYDLRSASTPSILLLALITLSSL